MYKGSRIISIVFIAVLFVAFLAVSSEAADNVTGKFFYTMANIWYDKPGPIELTNYHRGEIILVGTKVKILEVSDGSGGSPLDPQFKEVFIRFEGSGGLSYRIAVKSKYAKPGTTVWDIFRQYFSEKDPMSESGAFRSLTAQEQKSVLAGEITDGMSKAAVLMAYGYPPGHKTPSLEADKWIYWENWSKIRTVTFDGDRVQAVDAPRGKSRGKKSRETKGASKIEQCIQACKDNTNRTSEQCFEACNK